MIVSRMSSAPRVTPSATYISSRPGALRMSSEAQWAHDTLTTVSSASKGAPHLGQARTMASGPEGPLSSLGGARRAARSGMPAGSYSNRLTSALRQAPRRAHHAPRLRLGIHGQGDRGGAAEFPIH